MKHIAWILILVLLAASGCCTAEESLEPGGYELNGDVITIRMPASGQDEWTFSISDPGLLELLTCEYDEAGGVFAASFRNFSENTGEVDLRLNNAVTGECCGVLAYMFEGGMEIDGTYVNSGNMLTFRMKTNPSTGYGWSHETSDPAALMPMIESVFDPAENDMLVGAGATYILAVQRMNGADDCVLSLRYGRSWEEAPLKSYELEF